MTHNQDIQRHLSDEGGRQAQDRRIQLGSPQFDLVLFSPANRCVETAIKVGGCGYLTYPVNELCYEGRDTPDGKALSEMFAKLGNANFISFDNLDTGHTIEAHGERAWAKAQEIIERHDSKWTLIAGHNPFIAAMGYVTIRGISDHWEEIFDTTVFSEAEGYTLTLEDGKVIDVELHR